MAFDDHWSFTLNGIVHHLLVHNQNTNISDIHWKKGVVELAPQDGTASHFATLIFERTGKIDWWLGDRQKSMQFYRIINSFTCSLRLTARSRFLRMPTFLLRFTSKWGLSRMKNSFWNSWISRASGPPSPNLPMYKK